MQQKYWLDSTTVRATFVQIMPIIVLIAKAFNVEIGNGEQTALIEGLAALVSLAAVVYAIYGRAKAQYQLTFKVGE